MYPTCITNITFSSITDIQYYNSQHQQINYSTDILVFTHLWNSCFTILYVLVHTVKILDVQGYCTVHILSHSFCSHPQAHYCHVLPKNEIGPIVKALIRITLLARLGAREGARERYMLCQYSLFWQF